MTNEVLNAILNRSSIRRFTSENLTDDQIQLLSDAALSSPSAMNAQNWQFLFVLNRDIISQINLAAIAHFRRIGATVVTDRIKSRDDSIFYGAALLVLITMKRESQEPIDAGIAVENLAIAAQSLGLGSCIIGLSAAAFAGEQAKEMRSLVQMPEDHNWAIGIAIGHPAITKDPHVRQSEKITYIR